MAESFSDVKLSDTLKQAQALISEGMLDEARNLVAKRSTQEIKDAVVHKSWGKICYDLELFDDAIYEWNLAIRDKPEDPEPYELLAELHEDRGNLLRAGRCWKKLVSIAPENPENYRRLGQVYEHSGQAEKAKEVYQEALKQTGDSSFESLLRFLELAEEKPSEKSSLPESGLAPSDPDLIHFITLFSGREGAYARQWVSPTGETGYTPIREPLSVAAARNHVLGNHTIGVYQLRLDDTVNFIAFDLDLPKYLLKEGIKDFRAWKKLLEKTHEAACLLVDRGAAHNIPVHIEDSGFKGRHCWIFLESPLPAKMARRFATSFLSGMASFPADVQIEIFPKQTRTKENGLGNLIKLPLGIHRRSGNRSVFLQPDGKPFPNQFSFLAGVRRIEQQELLAFIHDQHPSEAGAEKEFSETGEDVRPVPSFPKLIEEYYPDKDDKLQYLLSRCGTLRQLFDKLAGNHEISHDEYLVLVHTLGHLEKGPDAVNWVLKQCYNASQDQFLKSRLRGNPMSCPKIRSKISEISSRANCDCRFPEAQSTYPHPLLLLELGLSQKIFSLDSLQFQNLLAEYLKLRKQMKEMEVLFSDYEKKLEAHFAEAGIEQLSTPWGILERQVVDGKPAYVLKL